MLIKFQTDFENDFEYQIEFASIMYIRHCIGVFSNANESLLALLGHLLQAQMKRDSIKLDKFQVSCLNGPVGMALHIIQMQ